MNRYSVIAHFGYRSSLNCHKALNRLNKIIKEGHTRCIIKTDIKKYFDSINHKQLLEFLAVTIKDKYFLMYINRFLKHKKISCKGKETFNKIGIAQGNLFSPIIGNIYLHYVLDSWFNTNVKPAFNAELIRYCDDLIICLNSIEDAILVKQIVSDRIVEFGLELEENKTDITPFGMPRF